VEGGSEPIEDGELLYRRVPASTRWYDPATGVLRSEAFGPHKTPQYKTQTFSWQDGTSAGNLKAVPLLAELGLSVGSGNRSVRHAASAGACSALRNSCNSLAQSC
jgi:hypothetical protein